MKKPLIAIPMGDPAGIGPEIVLKAINDDDVYNAARCVVVGDKDVLEDAARFSGLDIDIRVIGHPSEVIDRKQTVSLIDLNNVDMSKFAHGLISDMCGQAAFDYIERCVQYANNGDADAVATTPINKESLKAAGVDFIGHTEIFGHLTNTQDPITMFEVKGMKVFFLTRHMSLRQACDSIRKERIIDYVIRCTEVLRDLGITDGTMAIAGLNPHCGENGLFGYEEVDHIIPAVEELKRRGYQVAGPIGADSVFHLTLQGKFNSVLSLYHDQGHIATKTLDFDRTVAITAGMPILRTSVDHGTAFDIAGRGIASPISMIEAILVAVKYAPNFKHRNATP